MKKILLVILSIFCVNAFAKSKVSKKPTELKHFVAGEYDLIGGENRLCSEDKETFSLGSKKEIISFGVHHGMSTVVGKEVVQGDAPGDTQCVYEVEDKVQNQGEQTILTFIQVHKCNDEQKHKLIKTVVVGKDKNTGKESINLSLSKVGEDSKEYECYWELQKPYSTASLDLKK